MTRPLTRPSATLSPLARGEGQQTLLLAPASSETLRLAR